MLRAAVGPGLASSKIRTRLALLCNQLDGFDETIALLGGSGTHTLGHDELLLLARARLGRSDDGDAANALSNAQAAFGRARDDAGRAAALVAQARALGRLNQSDLVRPLLFEALALDDGNVEAWTQVIGLPVGHSEADALLTLARGSDHTGSLAVRALAHAATGQHHSARALLDLDTLLHEGTIEAPEGWADLNAFNLELSGELLASPAIREGRHGTASVASRRIDSLVAGGGPLASLLVRQIIAAAQRQARRLGTTHPWAKRVPRDAILRSWCIITDRAGFERWHMHPAGWMSGVYYVQVPQAVSAGDGPAGCLKLGLPETLVGEEAATAVGHRWIRPRSGLLALFPSHCFHRSFPHEAAGKRICVAFDISNAER